MKPLKIKGNTADEKFKHLERILQRFSRRLHRTVVGLVPSSPVFGFVANPAQSPVVLRAIFPADGVITKAAVFVGKSKGTTEITATVKFGPSVASHLFEVKKKALVEEVNFPVEAGAMLEVEVLEPLEDVANVWVGLLYEVSANSTSQIKIAIDQLESIAEEALHE